ncbi:MAG: response regulator, partial [Acetatifactor sp.]|nr:response regulator [Acetatifactor sp.]
GRNNIAVMLFIVSIVLVVLLLLVIATTKMLHRKTDLTAKTVEPQIRGRRNFYVTIFITLTLMIASGVYTSRLLYRVSVTEVLDDGETVAASVASDFENYLGAAKSILWVTADTVEMMVQEGQSLDYIEHYLMEQTSKQAEQFDENFTGLYAYVEGRYLDGLGWVPPKDYNVENRDWYKIAVAAGGEITIVSPYVDAQTGSVVITFCKILDDNKTSKTTERHNVVALDMVVNHIQNATEDVNIDDKGYGMVLNRDGVIIAHHDPEKNGKNISEFFGDSFINTVLETDKGMYHAELNGEKYTLFVNRIFDQWYVVIPVGEDQLFEAVYHQLLVTIIVTAIISILISFFYYIGYKNEQINSKKVEELKATGLKNEYEARMLKLEKKAADEANEAKSQFLAQMSHEIRTPINAVLGMNEMILRESKDENILDYSFNIQSAGQTLLSLINDILDFSKIEDGKMDLVPVQYDLASLINDLVISINERAKDKGLTFTIFVDETLPSELFGDDVRIRQIIMNLLTNAVKYTEAGTVTLTIKNGGITEDRLKLSVAVEDTGIGIRNEDMAKLFEAFERIDEKRNRNIEGTGLGMSIVTNLLRMMNSELCVESTYGKGSVFSFDLEQKVSSMEPIGDFKERIKRAASDTGDKTYLKVTGARILVVDDNAMNRKVVAALMKRNGIVSDMASSGTEAIEKVKSTAYDVIFLDHMMPVMDGIETLQKMKADGLLADNTEVIALTANAVEGARKRYLAAGFDGYLSKPIEVKKLEQILEKHLPAGITEWVEEDSNKADVPTQTEEDTIMEFEPIEDSSKKSGSLKENFDSCGINTAAGLRYCANDEDFYREIVGDYTNAYEERSANLLECFEKEDWHNYEILVHALKSTSKSIGADSLSENARILEFAARDGDYELIRTKHEALMADYTTLIKNLRNAMQA